MIRCTVILLATVLVACGGKGSPEQDVEWEDVEPVDPAVEPAEEPASDPALDPVDLLGTLVSPISQQADGTYSSAVTWGGAYSVDTVTGYACTSWTSTSSTRLSASGKGGDTLQWFWDFHTFCDSSTTYVYCLER